MRQSAVLLQAYIQDDKVAQLTDLLNGIGNPDMGNPFFPFNRLKSVHFGRWMIAPATDKFRASLIYSANIDGTVEQHLQELVREVPEALDSIFSFCDAYPSASSINDATRLSYLKQHSKKTPTFYVGAPNRTVEQVHAEAKFHKDVKDFVVTHRKQWTTDQEAFKAVQNFAQSHPDSEKLKKLAPPPKGKGFVMILFLLLLLAILPLLIVAILILAIFFEWREKSFRKFINMVPEEHIRKMKDQEDIVYQNQLSQVFETKMGLRKILLQFFLWATNFAAKNWYVKGSLMGTPTIHFARWVFIDGGKRFIFFSNFDQSYDGYLGDFVDNNGWGLNAIYGAAVGYPRTYFVFAGGSYRLLEFLGWGRLTQVQTNAWYSAYPWYGLQQIVSRTELRYGLLDTNPTTDQKKKELLKRI